MSIAIYLRVSTKHQELSSQRHRVEQWCERSGVSPSAWYIDRKSGATLDRPQFAKLQRAIGDGQIKHVVMYSLDRFARNMVDGLVEIDRWQKAGVKITFVSDGMELALDQWTGGLFLKMMVAIQLAMAEAEREKIFSRVSAGRDAAQQRFNRVKQLQAEGYTPMQAAIDVGMSVEKVGRWFARANMFQRDTKAGGIPKREALRRARAIVTYKMRGMTHNEIRKLVLCHMNTVTNVLKRYGTGLADQWKINDAGRKLLRAPMDEPQGFEINDDSEDGLFDGAADDANAPAVAVQ